jgi:maleate cis-trans isomerase
VHDPEDVARRFEEFLRDGGLEPVGLSSGGIITAEEVGRLDRLGALELAERGDQADAELLLIPDTAMHTIELLGELEAAAGKPVLTANQVTAWAGLRLAGRETVAERLGTLFAAGPPA